VTPTGGPLPNLVRALAAIAVLAAAARAQPTKPSAPSRFSLVQAQCAGRCTCAADADCGTAGTCGGGTCSAGEAARTACNADTDCAPTRTCAPAPGPCSSLFRMTAGSVTLRSAKQPAPTRDPKLNNAGDVRLVGVTRGGAPFTGTLGASVVYKTTFGTDTNGNCVLDALQIATESLTATLACRNGKCVGRLVQIAALPKQCADVAITSEFVSTTVKDESGAALATAGLAIPAGRADAP